MADFALPPQLRIELERIATAVFKPAGDALFRRGDQVSGTYLIRSGKVRHCLESKKELYPTRMLGAGCVASLPATMSGSAYSLTATVAEDAELGFVSRDAYLRLMAKDTSLCFQTMDFLSREITDIRSAISTETFPV